MDSSVGESSGLGHLRSFATLNPDNPVAQTGVLGERGHRPISSRFGRGRVDMNHAWLDPLIAVGPWVLALGSIVLLVRGLVRAVGRRR
ncbi:MAG: hypothetical protein WBX17_12145 [Microbacterium sp.]